MTKIFTLVSLVIIIVFDVYIILKEGKASSISATIINWSHEYPSIPFGSGFLCGHLFWRMKDADLGSGK
jgi:hypothetical protein